MKKTILCVDDEKFITESLRTQIVQYWGDEFNVETCESGEETLELMDELEENEVVLVISDYMMPRLKGDDLLIEIHKKNPKIITMLLTGQATMDGVVNTINHANLFRYISKPWVKEDIELAISQAINSYRKDRKIEKQNEELRLWSDKFIETMGATLDKRDTTTAGHSNRLADYAVKLARAINAKESGKYANVFFSDEQMKELCYAALLHDIGKIGVKESVLLKQNRLSIEQQHKIMYKYRWIKSTLDLKAYTSNLELQEQQLLNTIERDLEYILMMCSREYITEEEGEAIRAIASKKYREADGSFQPLLDAQELENLLVLKGNLTDNERSLIQAHAEHTYNILLRLPWPKELKNVPEIAASHHEKLNGTGYFRRLKDEEISIQARILAIIDIYEALTAADRPYKPAKTHQEALKILQFEVEEGALDGEIYEIFSEMDVRKG